MAINDDQMDALKEVMNIAIGQAANSLASMIGSHVDIHIPNIDIRQIAAGDSSYHADYVVPSESVYVSMKFSGSFSGFAVLLLSADSSQKLVALLTDRTIINF